MRDCLPRINRPWRLILCRLAKDAERGLETVRERMAGHGLTLHPAKTRSIQLAPVLAPKPGDQRKSESSADILKANFGQQRQDDARRENPSKPTKKALSDGVSDKAFKVEAKGLEPSTSALRTQRSPS
jgi:hypothetical protein